MIDFLQRSHLTEPALYLEDVLKRRGWDFVQKCWFLKWLLINILFSLETSLSLVVSISLNFYKNLSYFYRFSYLFFCSAADSKFLSYYWATLAIRSTAPFISKLFGFESWAPKHKSIYKKLWTISYDTIFRSNNSPIYPKLSKLWSLSFNLSKIDCTHLSISSLIYDYCVSLTNISISIIS